MSQNPAPLSYAQPPQQATAREGFLLRFCAALIDVGCGGLPAFLLGLLVAAFAGHWFGNIVFYAGFLAYTSLEIFKSATPGKMLLKLKITNEDGSEANRQTLMKRWAIKQIPNFVYFAAAATTLTIVGWVGVFCMIGYVISCCLTFRPDRQALHDTFAHTAVFRTQTASAAMPMPTQEQHRQAA